MILLALIGAMLIAQDIAESQTIYSLKWYLAKYKIRYNKERIDMPISTQMLPLKPLDCNYCLSFWISLLALVTDNTYICSILIAYMVYKLSKLVLK
jgi:hypothetical protein